MLRFLATTYLECKDCSLSRSGCDLRIKEVVKRVRAWSIRGAKYTGSARGREVHRRLARGTGRPSGTADEEEGASAVWRFEESEKRVRRCDWGGAVSVQ